MIRAAIVAPGQTKARMPKMMANRPRRANSHQLRASIVIISFSSSNARKDALARTSLLVNVCSAILT